VNRKITSLWEKKKVVLRHTPRADRALHALLGMKRFPNDGTIRNLFKGFTQAMVAQMYKPLWAWPLERLPKRDGHSSLDLDSTVFEPEAACGDAARVNC